MESPEPNEAYLLFLRRTGRLDRLLLCAWSQVEFNVDQAVTGLFGMTYDDEKAKLLTDWPFGKKLDFLKKWKVITKDEYSKVRAFQERRNKIFHRSGLPILHTMSENEKHELMNQAVEAAQISLNILFPPRSFHYRSDHST